MGEGRADDRVVVEADRGLQRAADEQRARRAGQHRAGEPAQAHAAAVGRSVRDDCACRGILVAEVERTAARRRLSLGLSCQTPVARSIARATSPLATSRQQLRRH